MSHIHGAIHAYILTETIQYLAIKRKIRIKAQDEATLNLVITVSKDEKEVQSNLEYYRVEENIKQEFNIARARAEEEAKAKA